MTIPSPHDVTALSPITEALNAATHDERVAWIRSLNQKAQLQLFALAEGNPVSVKDMVRDNGEMVRHIGRNGLVLFNDFEKRFGRVGDTVVGYNYNPKPWLRPIVGPGHYIAYDSPDQPGEIWVDYRTVPTERHPEFPDLRGNETGLPALVYGNMVDVIRRVSDHVFIGDSYKNRPRPDRPGFLCRVGSALPTAPFVMCQEPANT